MTIRSLMHAGQVRDKFADVAQFDKEGNKHYMFFDEKGEDTVITLMKYPDGTFTTHRRSATWQEQGETVISEIDACRLLWHNRAKVNQLLKEGAQ